MEFQIKGCGYRYSGFEYRLPTCPRETVYPLKLPAAFERILWCPPSGQHTRVLFTNQGVAAAKLPEAASPITHSFTWVSMRALRSSSSFFFLMFSFSCLASDTAWRNWSKMPKNSSGCILPASSPKCFTALVNWRKGGFKKFSVLRLFHDQI